MKLSQKFRCILRRAAGIVSVFCIAVAVCLGTAACTSQKAPAPEQPADDAKYKTVVTSHEVIGNGGYGAVFHSAIDPYNTDYYAASCDMGSLYFSFDAGASWTRHNIDGTILSVKYDPGAEGVVWAAGSGVYKSEDHGKTVRMVFPKPSDITASGHNYENANVWLYTDKKSDYAPHYQIWSIAVNRKSGGKNVFVAQRIPAAGMGYNNCIRVYSTDDGENFSLFAELEYSYNYKIDYDENTDCLVYITPDKIVEVGKDGKVACTIEQPVTLHFGKGNNIAFDSHYDAAAQKTTFVFGSPVTAEHVGSACYMTTDLRDKTKYTDLTAQLCELTTDDFGIEGVASYNQGRPSYEYCEWIKGKTVPQQFKWTIEHVAVADSNVAYLFHEHRVDTFDSDGSFYINRRTQAYIKYDATKEAGKRFTWVYGMPLKPHNTHIANVAWPDADSDYSLGMDSVAANPDALLFCSNVGIYYSDGGQKVRQLYTTVNSRDTLTLSDGSGKTEEKELSNVTSTGMDVICTHSVRTDPFDSEHLLMCCTDIGILQSYDNGKSWYHSLNEWQNGELKNISYAQYTNTCFDVHFDKERRDVVYGLWSLAKSAPTSPGSSYITSPARFGISYDGGLSWTMKKITPDGCCLPYKLLVEYNGSGRDIYVTTDSHGFFVTHDDGDTFTALNAGIDTSAVGDKTAIWGTKLLRCELGTFAVTGGSATDPSAHMLYKLNESTNTFEKVGLPETEPDSKGKTYVPAAIRDIIYDDNEKCLYLACTANVVTNYATLDKRAGGIWKYKDGRYTQVYDDTISVNSVRLDGSGRLYAAEYGGRLIRYDNNNTEYEVLYEGLFHIIKGFDFGVNDDIIYVATWGGSVEKLVLGREKI